MDTIALASQRASVGNLVALYRIITQDIGGETFCFTSGPMGGHPVVFQGISYAPIPIEATGFEYNGTGPLPTPKLAISNINSIITGLVIEFGDLVGATVQRIRTFENFLDGQPDADPFAAYPMDVFRIERKSVDDMETVEWELSVAMDQEGVTLPSRYCLRDTCTQIYRSWNGVEFDYTFATCPYAGAAMFKRDGTPTGLGSEDDCGRRLSDCKLRFGTAPLPTRAFPGIART